MHDLFKFFHVAAAILWMGGMAFLLLALRPAVSQLPEPAVRLVLMSRVLGRFFAVVAVSIAVLLGTGLALYLQAPAGRAPAGWHAMAGLGLLMMPVFGHLYFSPFRRLRRAVAAADWPEAGRRLAQATLLAKFNLGLGWVAIAAVMLWR